MRTGIVNRERAEQMVAMFQDGIKSRHEWFERGLISKECRDLDIAFFTQRMKVPLGLLDILNR